MHQHQWEADKIMNGAQGKWAAQMSDGAKCACGLVAKAPSHGPLKSWLTSLPK